MGTYHKERWGSEERAFFEYHCWESEESSDAELWHRTHQVVEVLHPLEAEHVPENSTFFERAEWGTPLYYRIRFEDGWEGDAFEDELLTSEEGYERPNYCKREESAHESR